MSNYPMKNSAISKIELGYCLDIIKDLQSWRNTPKSRYITLSSKIIRTSYQHLARLSYHRDF